MEKEGEGMTAKEAAEVLASLKISGMRSGKTRLAEAMNMAIKALSQDGDTISRQAAIDAVSHMCSEDENGITVSRANVNCMLKALPSAQSEPSQVARDIATIIENEQDMRVMLSQPEPCDSHENKVFVDKDAYERCKFEYLNACKITQTTRTPDTRQSDINDAYAVIKALQPLFGEESF